MDETQPLSCEEMAANAAAIAENADARAPSDASAAPTTINTSLIALQADAPDLTTQQWSSSQPASSNTVQRPTRTRNRSAKAKDAQKAEDSSRALATRFPSQHRYLCPRDDCTSVSNDLSSLNRHASTIHNVKTKLSKRDVVIKPYGEWLAGESVDSRLYKTYGHLLPTTTLATTYPSSSASQPVSGLKRKTSVETLQASKKRKASQEEQDEVHASITGHLPEASQPQEVPEDEEYPPAQAPRNRHRITRARATKREATTPLEPSSPTKRFKLTMKKTGAPADSVADAYITPSATTDKTAETPEPTETAEATETGGRLPGDKQPVTQTQPQPGNAQDLPPKGKGKKRTADESLRTSSPKRTRMNAAVRRNEAATSQAPSPKLASYASEADHPVQADAQETLVRSKALPWVLALPQLIVQAPSGEQATMASANMVQQTSQPATRTKAKAKKATNAPRKQKPLPNGNALSSYSVNVERRSGMVSSMGLEKSYPVDLSVHPPSPTPQGQVMPAQPTEEQDPEWQDAKVKVPSMVELDQAELESAPILSAYIHQKHLPSALANDLERTKVPEEVQSALKQTGQPGSAGTYARGPRDGFHVDLEHAEEVGKYVQQLKAGMMEYEGDGDGPATIHDREKHVEEDIDSFENATAIPRLNSRQQFLDLVEAISPAVLEQVKKDMGYKAELAYQGMPPTAVTLAAIRDLQNVRNEINDMDAAHQREMQAQDDVNRRDMQAMNDENARLPRELASHMELLAANKSAKVVAKVNDEFERGESLLLLWWTSASRPT